MNARASAVGLGQPGAVAALGLILVALCLGGAQSAAAAASLAMFLSLVLVFVAARSSGEALVRFVNQYWLSIIAAVLFITYATATAWIAPSGVSPFQGLWHPLWREMGLDHGAISIAPYRTIEGVVSLFAPLAAFALGALSVRTREDRRALSMLLVAAAAILGALSMYWLLTGADTRLMAQFGSANAAATTFGVLALLLTARLLRASRRPSARVVAQVPPQWRAIAAPLSAPLTFCVLALTLACLLLTGSRAGILATIVAFAIIAVLIWAPWRRAPDSAPFSRGTLLIIAALALVLLVSGGQILFSRMLHVDADASVRTTLLDMHWRIFLDRPWIGHGLNTFHELNAHYLTPDTWRDAGYVGSTHNIYVQALEEVGIIGFILLTLMIAPVLLKTGANAVFKRSGSEWAAAAFAGAALALIHGVVDFGFQTPAIAALIMFSVGAFSNGAAVKRSLEPNQ